MSNLQKAIQAQAPTFESMLKASETQIAAALPKHMSPERMLRVALTCYRTNPKLKDCEPVSLVKCFVEAAQLGLEPGVNGEAYLVPYGRECTLIPGYRGLIKNARRSDEIAKIDAYPIYEGDEYEVVLGIDPQIIHKPKFKSTKAILYYAFCKLKSGEVQFVIRTREQIEKHRDRYSKQANGQAWRDSFDEMALKTVIRNLCKRIPSSIELLETIAHESKVYEADYEDTTEQRKEKFDAITAPAATTPANTEAEDEAVRENFRRLVIEAEKLKINASTLYNSPDEALESLSTDKLRAVNVILEQRIKTLSKAQG